MNANVYTHTTEWKQKSNITELPAIYIKLQPWQTKNVDIVSLIVSLKKHYLIPFSTRCVGL